MSTFSGLNTAYTGLTAARQGLNVVGQNIANVNTEGYTRQRVTTSSVGPLQNTGLLAGGNVQVGQGVSVDAIARLGDMQLDARVRFSAGVAGYSAVRADAMSELETSLREPGENGISAQLQEFWTTWQDLSNRPGDPAAAAMVLDAANILVTQIQSGYQEVREQWSRMRANADSMTAEVNGAAAQVARLNEQIQLATATGSSPNELLDQRNLLTTSLASLTGATVRHRSDGQVDVLLNGNALVRGSTARALEVRGPTEMGADNGVVELAWADGDPVMLDSGRIAGALSVLGSGPGDGPLRQAAGDYNSLATALATSVNAIYGQTNESGDAEFFDLDPTDPEAALDLKVAVTDATAIQAGAPDLGALDGSIADKISQIPNVDPASSPDRAWEQAVTRIGVDARTELRQSELANVAADSAVAMQLSNASVDLDEENVNLLMYQHAYQGAARVMTAVDEMLDTLINRTGLVGR